MPAKRRTRNAGAEEPAPSPALERWLAPTVSSTVDRVAVTEIHEGWVPERSGELPLTATVAMVKAVGVVDPVLLRPRGDGGYEVVAGHRTVAAARAAGLDRVPAVVRVMDDAGALMALALDGSATGRLTAGGAHSLRGRLLEAGIPGDEVDAVMASVATEPKAAAEEAASATEPEPAATETEPVAAEPEPEPVTAEPEPVIAEAEPGPVTAEAEPEPAALEPVPAQPEPEPAAPEPVATRPQPEPVAAASAERVGALPEQPPSRWVPLPAGAPRLARLSSAFADAPRMLRILATDRFTGVVDLAGPDGRKDALTFLDGACIATRVERDGRPVDLPLRLPSPDSHPVVEMTVRPHPAPVVVALALALRSPARFTGLHAAFVHLPGLLAALEREHADAACVVTSPAGAGVILLAGGAPVAAYARRRGEGPAEEAETTDVDAVADLLSGGEGEVDVHGGPVPSEIDLEALIAGSVGG